MISYKEKKERARMNSDTVGMYQANLTNYYSDFDKEERERVLLCRFCYYMRRGGIHGQGFTTRKCDSCGVYQIHATTDTNRICSDCALDEKCCKKCVSGDVGW